MSDVLHIAIKNEESDDDMETGIVTRERVVAKVPKLYKVILLNDDYTPMEFVVEILRTQFNKDHHQATEVMLTVHNVGKAVCGIYPLEIAETKVAAVTEEARKSGYPLQCVTEKE